MATELYRKERKELKAAEQRFITRGNRLFEPGGERKYLGDEHARQSTAILQQFDITARKLLRKADRDAEKQRARLQDLEKKHGPPEAIKRAQLFLEAAEKLRHGVLRVRAELVGFEADPTELLGKSGE